MIGANRLVPIYQSIEKGSEAQACRHATVSQLERSTKRLVCMQDVLIGMFSMSCYARTWWAGSSSRRGMADTT